MVDTAFVMLRKNIASAFLFLSQMVMSAHPVPENPLWLNYPAAEGAGKGKLIVLISADQEYRSEQSMPMLANLLSQRYGFDCTVLFGVNEQGLVDPTAPVYPEKGKEKEFKPHNIPGLEHLAKADLMIFATRLQTLPEQQMKYFAEYYDSGKPFIAVRTANHGFRSPLPYEIEGKRVTLSQILGGTFLNHHGEWSQDSTRGDIVPAQKNHPILTGVKDIWGLTDVYRTYPEGESLPADCTALVMGQPLIGRVQGGANNPDKEPLPVVWTKLWTTSKGAKARVIHNTMGSAKDFENPGLRRLMVNGVFWALAMEDQIKADSSVEPIKEYNPLSSGFHYEKLGVKPQPPSAYR